MSKNALIIDNDFFFVEFLAEVLEKRAYHVLKAYDGKEGISKLVEESIDLLFLDMLIPKIDGPQLIKFTRTKFPDARFPIIAVSGTMIEQVDEISEMGADYYIAKGPTDIMTDYLNPFLDRIEAQPFPVPEGETVLEPGKLYPRRATVDLMDHINFQRAIIEDIGLGLIIVDKDTRVINMNSLAFDMIKKSIVDVLNCRVTDIFPGREKARVIDTLKRLISNRELRRIIFSAAIHSRIIRIIISVLRLNGEMAGWIIAMEDTGQEVEEE